MVTALVLSGGVGARMGADIPKQYMDVAGKPVILYTLEKLERQQQIDAFIVVAERTWQPRLTAWMEEAGIRKCAGYAEPGASRQGSVFHGLQRMQSQGAREDDIVLVHDAVRPCVSGQILKSCVDALENADGAMPVLPVKDTVYTSGDGTWIGGLLDRDKLFAGQAPESFRFGKYYAAHLAVGEKALDGFRGSSEIAHLAGMRIRLLPGDSGNYKITTPEDLERFRAQMENRGESS